MTPSDSTQGRDRPAAAEASYDPSGGPHSGNHPHPTTPSAGVEPAERAQHGAEQYLSAGDAARLLCVSARTVSRWADQGRIPHLVTLGGHRRFSKANILELTRRGQREGEGMSAPRG